VILSLPALEAARAEYTEVWAPRNVLPLIRFADRTRATADTGLDWIGVREDASLAALEGFDSIYSWYGAARPEFREAVAHLPVRFFRALPPPADGVPRIAVPEAPVQDLVAMHPFASSVAKRWPTENFRAVAAQLNVPVRWIAGPEEALDDAVRFDDLYELGCWIARARAFVGNDSGIAHLAAAVGTPVVAIFQASDPQVWAPRGERVRVLECPRVEEVVTAVRLTLEFRR
jgi:ADP-heptose:LPS heptosyltransferase